MTRPSRATEIRRKAAANQGNLARSGPALTSGAPRQEPVDEGADIAVVDDPVAAEIWRQTKAESSIGRLSIPKPFDWAKAIGRVITPRFGIEQLSSKGRVKIRCIDDFRFSGVNATTSSEETRSRG